jgi:hypothetical protein
MVGEHEIDITDVDYERIKEFSNGNAIFVRELHTKGVFYPYIKKDGRTHLLARIIMRIRMGNTNKRINYRDDNPLNLTRENLVIAEQADIIRNAKKSEGTTSKYKGVSWDRHAKKWKAQINPGDKKGNLHLGYFHKEADAAVAYDTAARGFFGEFALLNFPDKI